MTTPTEATRELGRRAAEGDKEALAILREMSVNPNIPAKRRNLAAKLFVDAGGRP
jgi:uncharacterized protein (UPF0147 family)